MTQVEFSCKHRFAGGFSIELSFQTDRRVTALFGPSGAGKTSVLSMLAGFLQPAEGQIRIGSSTVFDSDRGIDVAPNLRGLGIVSQERHLFPHMTVEGNLTFGQRRRTRPADRVPLERVVQVLDLQHTLTRKPATLSGGEQQRVAIGRALLSGPEMLLFDEPTSGLDRSLQARVLDYVERVLEEWSIPLLLVSHAEADVRRLASDVIVVREGRMVFRGPPEAALIHGE